MTLKIATREPNLVGLSFLQIIKRSSVAVQLLLCMLAVPFTGCGGDDIRVYRLAKEVKAPGSTSAKQVPHGWEATPPGEMRVASFRITGQPGESADVSVIPLPGQAGHDVDNVNRWRGQVGLPAVSENELPRLVQPAEIGGQMAQLYEMSGQNPGSGDTTSILAAILRKEDMAWFFKMTGNANLVAQQKAAFVLYLKTFEFPSRIAEAGSKQTELPPGHPPLSPTVQAPSAANPTAGRPTWAIPSEWHEIEAGQFLVAKFVVPGSKESQAVVNVSTSAGDGGGVAANVNRWRKQLGLTELRQSDLQKTLTPTDGGSAKASLVELTGTDTQSGKEMRMIAMIVPERSETWFYKLTGAAALVDREKESFIKFVQTSKYTE